MWRAALAAIAALALLNAPVRAQSADADKAIPTPGTFSVKPGDVLEIGVWPDENLGGQFVVEESGFVYLPILGRVRASGISLDRLREELRRGYGTLIKNPVVTITPLFRVGVIGSVQRPGTYMANPSDNLFDVLLDAGWLSDGADAEKIRVVRATGQTFNVNAQRTLEGEAVPPPITLQSGDRIVVPQAKSGIPIRTIFTIVHSVLLAINIYDRIQR